MDKDTFYCSFVGSDYIVCECGETYSSEDALKEHLEKEHYKNVKEVKKTNAKQKHVEKVSSAYNIRLKQLLEPQDDEANEANVVVCSDTGKKYVVVKEEPETDEDTVRILKEHLKLDHPEEVIYETDTFILPDDVKCETIVEEMPTEEYVDESAGEDAGELALPEDEYTEVVISNHPEVEHNYGTDKCDVQTFYFCELCGKSFCTEKSVHVHMVRTHMKPPNTQPRRRAPNGQRKDPLAAKNSVCDVCGKKYASNAALRYHTRTHTGEKPYHCPMCPRKFTMPLFLQIHVRTHTGERPYQCSVCVKAFSSRAALLRHDRVHTGVKPYQCPECDKAFTQSNSMKLHVRTVHRRLPTPYKSKARRLKEMLRRAMKENGGEEMRARKQVGILVYREEDDSVRYEETF